MFPISSLLRYSLQLEQENQTLASLVEFLTRLVDAAVSPPRLPLPESPSAVHTGRDADAPRRSNEAAAASQMPALSLDALQWEQLRVDQALLAHISFFSAKVAQLEASAAEALALHQDALSKGNEIKEECARARLHGV